jgi:hypothetical protein
MPRGAILSLLSDLNDPNRGKEAEIAAQVIDKMAKNPDFFGPTAQRRINRAMSGNGPNITDTVQGLMKDRAFRRKMDELPPTEPVSTPEPELPQPGANIDPLGIAPPGAIDAAVSRAEAVPQGQAQGNFQNTLAQQTAAQLLQEVQGSSIPDAQKQAIMQAIGDPAQMTPEKLQQLRQMLGSI